MPNLNPDVINPLVALIAGILILIMPRLLNYVSGDLSDRHRPARPGEPFPLQRRPHSDRG